MPSLHPQSPVSRYKSPDAAFDIAAVPFSYPGSFISFSRKWPNGYDKSSDLHLRLLHGPPVIEFAKMVLKKDGKEIPFTEKATPTELLLKTESGELRIRYIDSQTVVFKGRGVQLHMKSLTTCKFDMIQLNAKDCWLWQGEMSELQLFRKRGKVTTDAPWTGEKCEYITVDISGEGKDDNWEILIRETRWARNEIPPYKSLPWVEWLKTMPAVPRDLEGGRKLAAYILWSCIVDPAGRLTRPAIYMSKNWMTQIWSWDHCFNAIALAKSHPKLAWDQLCIMFDYQSDKGQLPDCVGINIIVWAFVKPPIHGWALREMMRRNPWFNKSRIKEMYEPLCKATEWWFRERDRDHDGLPQYNHGNDSGWDNSTLFKVGMPVEGPDLATFLTVQMDVLSDLAAKLGKKSESIKWKKRADKMVELLIKHNWRGDHFVAPRSGDHVVHESDSLVAFMPLLLGKRLPEEIRSAMLKNLKEDGRFLTPYGLATESVKSSEYEPDGYWRGPIWAPSTYLIISGLVECGEREFALEVAKRFSKTCATSGMAENFNALTGEPLRDPAYTWTSSVFMLLASEWLKEAKRK